MPVFFRQWRQRQPRRAAAGALPLLPRPRTNWSMHQYLSCCAAASPDQLAQQQARNRRVNGSASAARECAESCGEAVSRLGSTSDREKALSFFACVVPSEPSRQDRRGHLPVCQQDRERLCCWRRASVASEHRGVRVATAFLCCCLLLFAPAVGLVLCASAVGCCIVLMHPHAAVGVAGWWCCTFAAAAAAPATRRLCLVRRGWQAGCSAGCRAAPILTIRGRLRCVMMIE